MNHPTARRLAADHRLFRVLLLGGAVVWLVTLALLLTGALPSTAAAGDHDHTEVRAVAQVAFVAWAEEDGHWTSAVAVSAVTPQADGFAVELLARLHERDAATPPVIARWTVPVAVSADGPTAGTPVATG